jgi:hypothetical protein
MFNTPLTLHPTGRPILRILYPSSIPLTYSYLKEMLACCTSSVFSFRLIHLDMSVIFVFIRQIWMRRVLPNHSSHFLLRILTRVLLLQMLNESFCSRFPLILWIYCNCQQASPPSETLYVFVFQWFVIPRLRSYTEATERVPWIVGMTALEASHSPPIAVFPSNPRWPMSTDQSACW